MRNTIANLDRTIKSADEEITRAAFFPNLVAAKKENIDLQLEAAYRERLQNIYKAITRRLVSPVRWFLLTERFSILIQRFIHVFSQFSGLPCGTRECASSFPTATHGQLDYLRSGGGHHPNPGEGDFAEVHWGFKSASCNTVRRKNGLSDPLPPFWTCF